MARDAQLAGDRVQTEYYLQYADHYHRVLSENRSRYEDQRPQRDDFDDEDGDDEMVDAAEEQVQRSDDRPERADRQERQDRPDRQERGERPSRRSRERRPRDADEQAAGSDGEDYARDPRMNGNAETISLDILPPAIGREPEALDDDVVEAAEPRRPRRRTRAVRPADGDEEIAPAA